MKDPYKSLGIEKDATQGEIKAAFRALARQYHPDTSTDPKAAECFKEINDAYEILGDEKKRKAHNEEMSQKSIDDLPAAISNWVNRFFLGLKQKARG